MTAVSKPKSSPPRAATTVLLISVEFSFMAPARSSSVKDSEKQRDCTQRKWKIEKGKWGPAGSRPVFFATESQRAQRRKGAQSLTSKMKVKNFALIQQKASTVCQENLGRNIPVCCLCSAKPGPNSWLRKD